MKSLLNKSILLVIALLWSVSCKNDETKVLFLGGTAPVLTVSSDADLVLDSANAKFNSLQFQWTNPNYQFSNGASTQDVTYTLQIDTSGLNFANPKLITELAFTNDLFKSFTVKELDNLLGQLELPDYKKYPFEFRIKATLANNSVPLYSNAIKINITTYLDTIYPPPSDLYITGSATPGGWQAATGVGIETVPPGQHFTRVKPYLFQIDKLKLTFNGIADGDNGFLLLPQYGTWNGSGIFPGKYGYTGDKHQNSGLGDGFKPNGSDFAPPSTTGTYKIVVNFKTGKYTLTQI